MKRTAVTSWNTWIHFFRSPRCPRNMRRYSFLTLQLITSNINKLKF